MFVVGTAGHVDHGKSALVRALTGIDPDRLQEEKERGMTIDLGFAWLTLPSGREVSIVDVPGHERFVKNMLAGVGGIDLALLVVAADEGVMPQTREHLAILDLLQVKSGLVVITKKDLVEEDWLELVHSEVEEVIKPTSLSQAPILTVSSLTGEGLPELLQSLDRLLDSIPQKMDLGHPRLPIDRVFTIQGFGTVVTGTLIDGHFDTGQEVEVVPAHLRSRIRGLQTHRKKVASALPGSRVAMNLSSLATGDLKRGDVVTAPGWLRETTAVDVRLRLISELEGPIAHNCVVTLHTGSSEVVGKVRLLERDELRPGETSWAQVKLAAPVAVLKGDFFILRTTKGTIGGGQVVDPHPRRHRRFQETVTKALATLERGSPEEILLQSLQRAEPCELKTLLERSSLSRDQAEPALRSLLERKSLVMIGGERRGNLLPTPGAYLASAEGWSSLVRRVTQLLEAYHRQFPLRSGMPKEELKSRLQLAPRLFTEVCQHLLAQGTLVEEGANLRLKGHQIALSEAQQRAVDAFLRSLEANPYSPSNELAPEPELLNYLIERRQVVKVEDNVIFSATAYEEMVASVVERMKAQGKITLAEVRDLFHTSRKYAQALMEHLDEQRITRRVGDERVLR